MELDTIENIGYITRALPGMSYLREMCTDSYMTRWLEGTKVDFMEPTQPRGRTGLAPGSQGSQQLPRVKEGHFLGAGASGYFGDLEKRGIQPNL